MLTLISALSFILIMIMIIKSFKTKNIKQLTGYSGIIIVLLFICYLSNITILTYVGYLSTDLDAAIANYEKENAIFLEELNKYNTQEIQKNKPLIYLYNEYCANQNSIKKYRKAKENINHYKFMVYFGGE